MIIRGAKRGHLGHQTRASGSYTQALVYQRLGAAILITRDWLMLMLAWCCVALCTIIAATDLIFDAGRALSVLD